MEYFHHQECNPIQLDFQNNLEGSLFHQGCLRHRIFLEELYEDLHKSYYKLISLHLYEYMNSQFHRLSNHYYILVNYLIRRHITLNRP